MDKNVFLHIGLPKTGTTSLQYLLGENRLKLGKQGFEYFHGKIGEGYNHGELYLAVLRPNVFTFSHHGQFSILTPNLFWLTKKRVFSFLN